MSSFKTLIPLFTGLFLCMPSPAAEGELLPSEVTVLINHSMQFNPGAERKALTTPIIARMQIDNLSEIERFMKGEAHFLHLQPEESRDEFWEFRQRDDDLGRVANQKLMIIRINAFRMVDELVSNDIPNYRRRFGQRPDDRFGMTFAVARTAQQLAARGDADQALDLVAAEIRAHDKFDGPYTAYALAGQFMQMAIDENRGDEFRQLNAWVLEGLNEAIGARLEVHNTESGTSFGLPGIAFRTLFEDRLLSYHDWTAKFMQLRDRISEQGGRE